MSDPAGMLHVGIISDTHGLLRAEALRELSGVDHILHAGDVGVRGGDGSQVAGTLFGKQQAPRIVAIDEHTVDLPPARHMLVVHNDDTPGMIGRVGIALGEAGVNISDMDVGRSPSGEAAMMVVATDALVPGDVVARVLALPDVHSARAIDLG